MDRKNYLLILISLMIGALTACTSSGISPKEIAMTPKITKQKNEKKEPAKEAKGMLLEGPGKWSGDQYDQGKVNQSLDQISGQMSSIEAYSYLLQLLAEDYRSATEKLDRFNPYLTPKLKEKPGKSTNQKIHIAILLDSSGSMGQVVNGGQKMKLAKRAIQEFAAKLPKESSISLRVYGHLGSNEAKDKEISCKSSELVYAQDSYHHERFTSALHRFDPTGYTPLARGLQEVRKDLPPAKEGEQNIVYVVSDGEETCGGDPVAEIVKLKQAPVKAIVQVIGFDVNDQGQQALKEMAQAADGTYTTVDSGAALQNYWRSEHTRLLFDWLGWRAANELELITLAKDKKDELEKIASPRIVLGGKDQKSLLYALASQEKQRLMEAANYLIKKGKIADGKLLQEKISYRYRAIELYVRKRYHQLLETIEKNQQHYQKAIQDQYQQKENEYD
ncbi:VWA domain-containing protein [Thermoflavimicrobium daqui]|uniref:VWFA domain-containing protein n=1 Tax=Thermoflavimicrobium daqui TaxID=2137476 RepID=A0A364K742_9BACL|nr:VWA domain-containing protein [Thermoflavimicrobium daqui]RAL26098.1 hypothetical protein DL897_03595 [Thermoflavimicrobium daqui]